MAKSTQILKDGDRSGLYAFACLLVVGSFLALSWVVAKLADEAGAPRLTFLMVALVGSGTLLLGLSTFHRRGMTVTGRTLEYALVTGALFALPNALGFLAVRHVGAGFISLSFAFPILITWLIAVLIGLETLRFSRLLGVLLGLSGGVILAAAKAGGGDTAPGWAALILAMPLTIAIGNIYRTLRWPAGASPIFLAAIMLFSGALCLVPFALTLEPDEIPTLFKTSEILKLLVFETLVFTVLYCFYFVLQKLAGPVYFSQIGTVAAVAGTLMAVFALAEAPPPNLALAGSLVAMGMVIFHYTGKKNKPSIS